MNATGLLEPVGTHPSHRRLGLARAACLEAIRAMQAHGARQALVCPAAEDAATVALYASLGFEAVDRNESFVRTR
jgi:ribosomal protein S18 acetylase RimI-like enzyme